jgi:hypothetical protein
MDGLEPGAAIVSNTMVCEVSRLLESHSAQEHENRSRFRYGDQEEPLQFADLLSLIEATVLHEELYTLPGRISKDADDLPLRQVLIHEGILRELDTKPAHRAIAKSIMRVFEKDVDPSNPDASTHSREGLAAMSANVREDLEEFLLILDDAKQADRDRMLERAKEWGGGEAPLRLDDTRDYFFDTRDTLSPLYASSLEKFGKHLKMWMFYVTGTYPGGTSVIRDMYYIFASEHFELPYWPESVRIDFARQFPNYFDNSLRLQLYNRLADAFRTTVGDLYDDHKEELVFIPPFAALALERSESVAELPRRILEIRHDFSKLRRSFDELEAERRTARSIDERLRFRRLQRTLMNEAASVFDRPSLLTLESVIRYVPNVIGPAMKAADPTKYSADLLLLPAKALIEWWTRRPIAKLFSLADKLREMERYEELYGKLFGNDPEPRRVDK